MDILVVDRDSLASQLIASRLQAWGHTVTVEPNKQEAFEKIKARPFECVLVDPYPMSEARPVIIGIWKNLPQDAARPYILLLSKAATQGEAILAGANDVLLKPLDHGEIETKIANAARLLDISRMLARDDNVHSGGGMVGKAAFNQLYLSAVDRAFRYGERNLIVFIEVTAGAEDAAVMAALVDKITFMRRQSDVVGRLSDNGFGILLQRPQYESEPLDALGRFSEILGAFAHGHGGKVKLALSLVEMPQGALLAEKSV